MFRGRFIKCRFAVESVLGLNEAGSQTTNAIKDCFIYVLTMTDREVIRFVT